MGLMTLIARKIYPDKRQSQLRAPPYERKLSATSPVRLVNTTSPTSGVLNGYREPKSVQALPRQLDGKEQLLSSSPQNSTGSAAPAPVVLGFRGDNALSRPVTSHGKHADSARAKAQVVQPPTSPKPSLRLSQLVTARSRLSLAKAARSETAVPAPRYAHKPQSSFASGKQVKLTKSDGDARGYVDLLDAQSRFKPSDFHTRVQATGARDYGEDVADRNIKANGANLESRPATVSSTGLNLQNRSVDQRRPFSSWNQPVSHFSDDDDDESNSRPRVVKQASIDTALRSKSINSSHQHFLAHNLPSSAFLKKKLALHRQSLNAPMPYASAGAYSTPSLDDIEAIERQQIYLNRRERGRSLQVSVGEANRLTSAWDTTSPESDNGSSEATPYSPVALSRPTASGGISRAFSESGKRSNHVFPGFEHSGSGPRFGINNQTILSPQPTSFRVAVPLVESDFTASLKRPSTVHSMQYTSHPQQAAPELHRAMPDLSNLPHHLKEKARNFKEGWHGDITDRDSAPSPFVKTSRSRSGSRENFREYPRASSTTTPRPQSQAGEVEGQMPGNGGSSRHWSITSTAPTTSSSSSATYPRSQSRHTANTSVDLSSSTVDSSHVSIHSDVTGHMPLKTYIKSDMKQRSPAILQSPPFNIDDYLSSDDDSFVEVQESRGESEEDLLFSNGYGINGMQLPGLVDAYTAPAPSIMRSPRLRVSRSGENLHLAAGDSPPLRKTTPRYNTVDSAISPSRNSSRARRSSNATEFSFTRGDSEREDLDEIESSKHAETKRLSAILSSSAPYTHHSSGSLGRNSVRYHPHPSHLFQHGSNVGDLVIEEEKFEKVDIATAIRLRKEAKSRKRASMMSTTSQSRGSVKSTTHDSRESSRVDEVDDYRPDIRRTTRRTDSHFSSGPKATPDIGDVPELAEDVGDDLASLETRKGPHGDLL